jgi:hypothetical protein
VYFASPLDTYWTKRYEARLTLVRRRFKAANILEPRHLFKNGDAWRAAWPELVRSLSTLVFIAGSDGSIGYGVFAEVHDARRHGIATWYLCDEGGFHRDFAFELIDGGASWRRYARVVMAGETVA